MDFEFVIPILREELLNQKDNAYCVSREICSDEIPQLLLQSKTAITSNTFAIFDHFDTFYFVLDHASIISTMHLFRAYDLLFYVLDNLGNELVTHLENSSPAPDDRIKYLNATKMIVYLMCSTVIEIDKSQTSTASWKKNKKDDVQLDKNDWDNKRFKCLVQIFNILQLPLEKLWDPQVAEESFVNLICDVTYRTLEHHTVKQKNVCDTVFQILGTSIKRYNHAITFPVRILQILRSCENAILPIAHGVHLLFEEFGITSIFSVLIKEVLDELSVDAADSQTSKFFGIFLNELSTISPKMMISHLSLLSDELLNNQSYQLRICLLKMIGDVVASELTSENLSEELKLTRDEFLEKLLDHMMDVNGHVRSKVLQIWNSLKEENAVPLIWQHKVLETSVDRLEDKSSLVRKNAIILIKAFLERNPFSAKLSIEELKQRHEEEINKLQLLREKMVAPTKSKEELLILWEENLTKIRNVIEGLINQETKNKNDVQLTSDPGTQIKDFLNKNDYKNATELIIILDKIAGNYEIRKKLDIHAQYAYFEALVQQYFFKDLSELNEEEFSKHEKTIQFLADSIKFSEIIASAVPKLQEMLLSKTNTDVTESINFFTTGYLFGIKGTEKGMKRMIYLVWSPDKEKRDGVINAYKKIFFTTDLQGRGHALKVVKNLSDYFDYLPKDDYAAFELLIKEWVELGDIDGTIIQVLFERFTLKDTVSDSDSRKALEILVMASHAKKSIATANESILEKIGIDERGLNDPRIFVSTLSLLMNLVGPTLKTKFYKRYDATHPLIEKILRNFKLFIWFPRIENFDIIASKTIDFIYHCGQAPDIILYDITLEIIKKIKELSKKEQETTIQDELITQQQTQETTIQQTQESTTALRQTQKKYLIKLPKYILARVIFTVGYIAMKEMIFLDIDVYNNMKYRQELKEEFRKNKDINKSKSLDTSASNALKRLSGTTTEQQQQEEELIQGGAEDAIAELINHICEKELLYSNDGLFAQFLPVIFKICKYPNIYNDDELQQSANLAFVRFMIVSSEFCEKNMPFLMNILAQTKNIKIKCNIIIAMSDFMFRFPNVIEPWTKHFYSMIHEENDDVRLTTVKVLSILIMHEMIRVKGQISDLALCIVDRNLEIRTTAEQFFKEIATKSNTLYNVLPDIISRLSDPKMNLEEEKYHCVMRYIIKLIEKNRQVETLVDKLCLRFKVTTAERQWRDIAFCLSLLNYSEKTIRKLIDNIQYFKDKVQVTEIYDAFKTIIANTSKLGKNEFKAILTEFETKLNECLETKDKEGEDGNAAPAGSGSAEKKDQKQKSRKLQKRNIAKGQKKRSKSLASDSSSDDDADNLINDDDEDSDTPPPPAKPSRREVTKRNTIIENETSTDSDEQFQIKRGRGKKRRS